MPKLPTCQHCQQTIESIEWAEHILPDGRKIYLFFCPGCRYAMNAQIVEAKP